MKMSRKAIVTSGRRPARPDGSYYRESRRKSLYRGGRRRGGSLAGIGIALAVALVLVVALLWYF